MDQLKNRVAVITGCSSGIGKQIAIRYAEEGAKLAICARRTDRLEETAAICREKGAEVLTVRVDIAMASDLENLVEETVKRFGTVDILVNNAMSGVPYTPLEEMPFSYFEHFLNTMLFSTVRLSQLCFPYMKESGGSIINIGSSTALGGNGNFYQSAYGTMKGAIAAFTRCTAAEWGKYGIRANLIYPIVATEAIRNPEGRHKNAGVLEELANNPLKRAGDPYRDVAPVAVFLGSAASGYLTGQSLRAEGGRFMGVC